MDSTPKRPSDVAMWHTLSGMPDNVTDEGVVVATDAGQRLQSEKALLRAEIASLGRDELPGQIRGMARLAASYLLAGDVETARRYVTMGRELLSTSPAEPIGDHPGHTGND
jgi:hypothetical protein